MAGPVANFDAAAIPRARLPANPQPRHLLPQRRAADAEQFGGLDDLAVGLFERTFDLPSLSRIADISQWKEARSDLGSWTIREKIAGHDPFRRRQCHGAVDPVA